MRYILQSKFAEEISDRRAYLYDTLQLWFTVIKDEYNNFILTSIPVTAYSSIFIIVGHNNFVKRYFLNNNIQEKTIVAITCRGNCDFKYWKLPGKEIYFPIWRYHFIIRNF